MLPDLIQVAGRLMRRSLGFAAPFLGSEIPVLTYHSIDDRGSFISITPDALRSQLERLRAENWRSLSIAEYAAQAGIASLEPRTLLITFDDGYQNFRKCARPLLNEFGFKATVFVCTDFVGKPPFWLERDRVLICSLLDKIGISPIECEALDASITALLREPLMDWPDLRELAGAGFDIQSHSSAHHFLSMLPPAQLGDDLARSRKILEDRLGHPVRAVAYPYGDSNPEVAIHARAAGFDIGFVSDHGPRDALRMMCWRSSVSDRLCPQELISLLKSWPLYPRLRHLLRRAVKLKPAALGR